MRVPTRNKFRYEFGTKTLQFARPSDVVHDKKAEDHSLSTVCGYACHIKASRWNGSLFGLPPERIPATMRQFSSVHSSIYSIPASAELAKEAQPHKQHADTYSNDTQLRFARLNFTI
ncbi:hypothetical protein Mapa_000411 [Marchantia paleacea]|nr:hypothetical protein Mapa_000411 [Marchantia paleacea]